MKSEGNRQWTTLSLVKLVLDPTSFAFLVIFSFVQNTPSALNFLLHAVVTRLCSRAEPLQVLVSAKLSSSPVKAFARMSFSIPWERNSRMAAWNSDGMVVSFAIVIVSSFGFTSLVGVGVA